MMATAFLGYLHGPKSHKSKNNNNNNSKTVKNIKLNGISKQSIEIYKFYIPDKLKLYIHPLGETLTDKRTRQVSRGHKNIRTFSTVPEIETPCVTLFENLSPEISKFIKEYKLNPCFIYEDLNNATIRMRIRTETRHLAGIYLILNKFSGDYYIGSASTDKFYSRFINHLFNFNGSKVLKNAVKKYKIPEFAFIILELFPEVVTKDNNKKLLDLEDFYLKYLLPNYNILTEAGSSFGYKHTEITRIKMRTCYSEEQKITIGNLNKGKILSFETREAMKNSALNRGKPIYSVEAKINMKNKSKAIRAYNLDYTVFGEFSSIKEGSKSLGCSEKTIRRALKSRKNILKRR